MFPNRRNYLFLTIIIKFDEENKVRDFVVTDRQGQIVGKVKDLILDANRRLNLVISQQTNQKNRKNHSSDI